MAHVQEPLVREPRPGDRFLAEGAERAVGPLGQIVGRLQFPQHLRRGLAERRRHVVGEAPQLDAVLVDQGLERGPVALVELAQHGFRLGPAGGGDDRLEMARQGLEFGFVDETLDAGAGLVEARPVVIFGDLVEAEGEVVPRPDPFGGVDPARCERREDFPGFNAVYAEYFAEEPPTRSALVSDFLIDILVEIECVAYKPQ